jgi:thiosulfate/3-mercaptopyruvate sulfurtransferase
VIDPVVDHDWLRAHGDRVILADVRWYLDGRSGRAAYGNGHLPGAVFVDLDRVLAAPPSPARGRHPLPDPEVFAAGLAAQGIGDGDTVVAYDDAAATPTAPPRSATDQSGPPDSSRAVSTAAGSSPE